MNDVPTNQLTNQPTKAKKPKRWHPKQRNNSHDGIAVLGPSDVGAVRQEGHARDGAAASHPLPPRQTHPTQVIRVTLQVGISREAAPPRHRVRPAIRLPVQSARHVQHRRSVVVDAAALELRPSAPDADAAAAAVVVVVVVVVFVVVFVVVACDDASSSSPAAPFERDALPVVGGGSRWCDVASADPDAAADGLAVGGEVVGDWPSAHRSCEKRLLCN